MTRLVTAILLILLSLAAAAPAQTTRLALWDALSGKAKTKPVPTWETPLPGFHRVRMVYPQNLWPAGADRTAMPPVEMIHAAADLHRGYPVILDIEHLPLDVRRFSDADVQRSIDLLREIVRIWRQRQPGARIGLYGFMPLRDYWTPVKYERDKQQYTGQFWAWLRANARLRHGRGPDGRYSPEGLTDSFDFVVASVYLFNYGTSAQATREREVYLKWNIVEARQYQKPVVAMVMPIWHTSTGGGYLPPDVLIGQLDSLADKGVEAICFFGDARIDYTLPWYEAVRGWQ